jgi:hypothetical protein
VPRIATLRAVISGAGSSKYFFFHAASERLRWVANGARRSKDGATAQRIRDGTRVETPCCEIPKAGWRFI